MIASQKQYEGPRFTVVNLEAFSQYHRNGAVNTTINGMRSAVAQSATIIAQTVRTIVPGKSSEATGMLKKAIATKHSTFANKVTKRSIWSLVGAKRRFADWVWTKKHALMGTRLGHTFNVKGEKGKVARAKYFARIAEYEELKKSRMKVVKEGRKTRLVQGRITTTSRRSKVNMRDRLGRLRFKRPSRYLHLVDKGHLIRGGGRVYATHFMSDAMRMSASAADARVQQVIQNRILKNLQSGTS